MKSIDQAILADPKRISAVAAHAARVAAEMAIEREADRDARLERVECLDRREWGVMRIDRAAKRAGVEMDLMRRNIRKSYRTKTLRFVFAGEQWHGPRDAYRVFCVQHREWGLFESAGTAAEKVGVTRNAIINAIKKNTHCRGMLWRYARDWDKPCLPAAPRHERPVFDEMTGRQHPTIWAAATSCTHEEFRFRAGRPNRQDIHRWATRIARAMKTGARWRAVPESDSACSTR